MVEPRGLPKRTRRPGLRAIDTMVPVPARRVALLSTCVGKFCHGTRLDVSFQEVIHSVLIGTLILPNLKRSSTPSWRSWKSVKGLK